MVKKYHRLLLVIGILLGSFFQGSATHIVGGALTYQFNGVNTYTFTLKLYRDCCPTCATLPATRDINLRYANGDVFTTATITLNRISTTTVTATLPPCATAPASPPCVEEHIYIATSVLTVPAGGLHVYHEFCCRNTTLTNTNASDQTDPQDGETFYAFIPGYSSKWAEDFTLANGTTSDAGPTLWTRTLGASAPVSAQVNNGWFEITGQNTTKLWLENFTLANGLTSDAGPTIWTSTVTAGTATGATNANMFRFTG